LPTSSPSARAPRSRGCSTRFRSVFTTFVATARDASSLGCSSSSNASGRTDEVVLWQFEGAAAAVKEVAELAQIPFERILASKDVHT
jgi:hypothetical protein